VDITVALVQAIAWLPVHYTPKKLKMVPELRILQVSPLELRSVLAKKSAVE
jgi:hypothetical protein